MWIHTFASGRGEGESPKLGFDAGFCFFELVDLVFDQFHDVLRKFTAELPFAGRPLADDVDQGFAEDVL